MMNKVTKAMGVFLSVCSILAFSVIGSSAYTENAMADTAQIPDANVANIDEMFRTTLSIATHGETILEADENALECMTKNIYFESGTESWTGKLAVGRVVLNRVGDSRFPDTVCGVVYEARTDANGNPRRNKCQFSWYCDGKHDRPQDQDRWVEAQGIAWNMVEEGKYRGITEGATHYHATYVNPRWAKTLQLVGRIGAHIFYRWE